MRAAALASLLLLAWSAAMPDCSIDFNVTGTDGVRQVHRLAVAAGADATEAALALATALHIPDPATAAAVLAAEHATECSLSGLMYPYEFLQRTLAVVPSGEALFYDPATPREHEPAMHHERHWEGSADTGQPITHLVSAFPTDTAEELAVLLRDQIGNTTVFTTYWVWPGFVHARDPAERPALCEPGGGARRSRFLVLGDSHARTWRWTRMRYGNAIDVTTVGGATAYGLKNADSLTGASRLFLAAIGGFKMAPGSPPTHLIVQLGEVDVASMWSLRRSRKPHLTDAQLARDSIDALSKFLLPVAPEFVSVTLIAVAPPTIGDVGRRAADDRPHNTDSYADSWRLTGLFNAALEQLATKRGWGYVDIAPQVTTRGPTGMEIKRPFTWTGFPDWHLRGEQVYAMYMNGVRRAAGLQFCAKTADDAAKMAAAAEAAAPLAALQLRVLQHANDGVDMPAFRSMLVDTSRPAAEAGAIVAAWNAELALGVTADRRSGTQAPATLVDPAGLAERLARFYLDSVGDKLPISDERTSPPSLAAPVLAADGPQTCVTRLWLNSLGRRTSHPFDLKVDADVGIGVAAFLAAALADDLIPVSRKEALEAAIYEHIRAGSCVDRPLITKHSALADLAACHAATAAEPLVFLTVGAHHWFPPTRDATLHDVAEAHGWTGVLVEAAPKVFAELSRRREAHPGGHKYWPVEAAACAATSNATFYAARSDMADRASARGALSSWATETGSLNRAHVVRTLFGSDGAQASSISDEAADANDRPDHYIEAHDVRCLSPADVLEAAVAAGAPPALAARGPALYYSDLEGADFPVAYAMLAGGVRPAVLVLEYGHREALEDDVDVLQDTHGYVLAGFDDEDLVFLDARGAAVPGTLNECLMDRWKLRFLEVD